MIKSKFVFAHTNVATEYAKLSTCKRLQVGCVLVKGNTPIAIGYNGTKPGQDNCCEGPDGRTLPGVRHAEVNALNKLWTSKESADGSVAFITHAPCLDCAQDLANAGIIEVYYRWSYTSKEGKEYVDGQKFLLEKGIAVYKVLPEIDTIQQLKSLYGKLTYETIESPAKAKQEAARAAGLVEFDYFEVREGDIFFGEVQPTIHRDFDPDDSEPGYASFYHAGAGYR